MAKNDKTPSETTTAPNSAPMGLRASFQPRRSTPPVFDNPAAERAWYREQEERERAEQEAASKYPPGSKLFVTTARGISRRGRAGLAFSDTGRTEVEVADLSDDELARVRSLSQAEIERLHAGDTVDGLEDIDPKLATRARAGYVVNPMGAKAIADDDGLQVWQDAGKADAATSADSGELDALRAENKSLREQVAKLKRATSTGKNDGSPERLTGSSEFGGDDKGKSNG